MGKLSKDALDIVLKAEMTEQDKQIMTGTAPQPKSEQQKGQFIKGDPQHTAGKKGFRIIGRIHATYDLKSEVIGYVLYNDKKKDFCQYTVAQVKSILAAYEFVNAELVNEEIHITDCAADKLLQFDNMMNPITPVQVVYVVERLTETVRAQGQAREQVVYSIVNKNLQVASITENNLMAAAQTGRVAISNLRVDNNYLAAKDQTALPSYTREVNYVTPNITQMSEKQGNVKLKFENHARFLDAMVAFLDGCVVLMDQPGYNTTYIAFGSLNNVKRGIQMLNKKPGAAKAFIKNELLPLYCARQGKNETDLVDSMNNSRVAEAMIKTEVYSYTYRAAVQQLRNWGAIWLIDFIKRLGLAGGLRLITASALLNLNYWGAKAEHPYIVHLFDTKEQLVINRVITNELCAKNNWPSPRIAKAVLRRLPLHNIKHLDETGELVTCGITRFRLPANTRRGFRTALMVWPMPAGNQIAAVKREVLTNLRVVDEEKEVQTVKPYIMHILSELNFAMSNEITVAAKTYTYKRVTAMTCMLFDYLMHQNVTIAKGLCRAILDYVPGPERPGVNISDPTAALVTAMERMDNKIQYTRLWTPNIFNMFIKSGGLVVPLKPLQEKTYMLPTCLWSHFAEGDFVRTNPTIISNDALFAANIMSECEAPRIKGDSTTCYFNTIAGRLRTYMEALGGKQYADYKIPGRQANFTSYYQIIGATQLYLIRPYYPNKYMLGLAQKRFTVPSAYSKQKPTSSTTHKVW